MDPLSLFHPRISQWFSENVGAPTEVQKQAWPSIAAGEHLLVSAPTGSGKTLAAFLWALNQLVIGTWDTGHLHVLYVSPLKALNNDVQRNLLGPLSRLKQVFESAGETFPSIRVFTRSGDTPQSERLRMQRHPPEILITTPESLNLLLSSLGGRNVLAGLSTVILDEIHAVIGTKRDVHLITAVDRLVRLSGEFQRIALSATIRPLEAVSGFIGGYRLEGNPAHPKYVPRSVTTICSEESKDYDIQVRFPQEVVDPWNKKSVWDSLAGEFKNIIGRNRSTLLFVNSRRLCEKITYKINLGEDRAIAYSHHGSLSREIRGEVERRLKAGELKAIVATNSLELGIDIGALDEVVLIQSPPSISSAIQRIGRAGHQVGQISRGTLFPTHSQDFLEAAVLAQAVLDQDIEAVRPVECPLDVLAQIIVSMAGTETWDLDSLYAQLRTSYPYRTLSRDHFDLVLNMLAGRYADTRIRELKPRVSIDRLDNTVAARKGALLSLYGSGGMIPDRGYFHLRRHDTNARIGELDEEFVWEARIGQTITIGTQNWRIERITHNDVFVTPAHPKAMATPFWRGEENNRHFHFSDRIARFLEKADANLGDPDYARILQQENRMDASSAGQLIEFLKEQKEATGCSLPHRHHLLLEFVHSGPGGAPGNQVVMHTMWGGRVNRPFGMALGAAWEARFGRRVEMFTSNDCIALVLPHEVSAEELLSLVTVATVETWLRSRLEKSGFFGARFRECSGRALLLTRDKFNERMPLWMSRLRSQRLLDSVSAYEDFPVLLETWRTCLKDEFDLENLKKLLAELETGAITWSVARTGRPSPMARSVSWRQVNEYMYMGDGADSGRASRLRDDLIRDVVFSPDMRPSIAPDLIERFEMKRRRLSPGYAPDTPRDLLDWVKERWVLPESEWKRLLEAVRRDRGPDLDTVLEPVAGKLVRLFPPEASQPLVAAMELVPAVLHALSPGSDHVPMEPLAPGGSVWSVRGKDSSDPEKDAAELLTTLLGEWLRFHGPVTVEFIATSLGVHRQRLSLALEELLDSKQLVSGILVSDRDEELVCDSENFEILLRMARSENIPAFHPLEPEWLPVFLADFQGVAKPARDSEALYERVEQLLCYFAAAESWETEILPARAHPYNTDTLDKMLRETELAWIGGKGHKVAFYFDPDLDLMREEQGVTGARDLADTDRGAKNGDSSDTTDSKALFPDPMGRYDFSTMLRASGRSPGDLVRYLWQEVWEGRVSNDTFSVLRRGIEHQFEPEPALSETANRAQRRHGMGRRSAFSRWKSALPMAGSWFRIPSSDLEADPVETEERNKDRVRLLLDRYGILFRELLLNEVQAFRWPHLFRSLRLMELSGELLSGCFFEGIPGPQFISHKAFRALERALPDDRIFWINAADPASLCGVPLDGLKAGLPRRIGSTHLVYKGRELEVISQRNGKILTFRVPPDDPRMQEYLGFLHHLLRRPFQPLRQIIIETVNDEEAYRSPYVDPLRTGFDAVVDYKRVVLYRRVA
ncbi:MAG: DEAD/DEAH box helicase [Deltaproteobacteria bacterium]|nr:DEAD/DEAH box helicase [Deltaproteobacteria bacterium]